MAEEEITESTVQGNNKIEKKRGGPSFWLNLLTLVLLWAGIMGVRSAVKQWEPKTLPEEGKENQIILEDLENKKPLVESEQVSVPTVGEKSEIRNPKKIRAVVKRSPYDMPDPYTDGSALDLDRQENLEKTQTKQPIRKEVRATPLLPTERDQFIPFESE